jgi:imidazole glycerol-phosphate synthase subunit HisF
MFRPRIIPVLLLTHSDLVKSTKFKNYNYIGDPLNAVKIYNDLEADELVFLDIQATSEGRTIDLDIVQKIGEEANMPFSVGGGITNIEQIRALTKAGAERVIIGSNAVANPNFIYEASESFGSSTISVCIDVKKNLWGKEYVWTKNGKEAHKVDPLEFALQMEEKGAGEIIIQSIEKDGMMVGFDVALIKRITEKVTIPVVALGGAGELSHFKELYKQCPTSGIASGSTFVYQGSMKGVLINYPTPAEKKHIYE